MVRADTVDQVAALMGDASSAGGGELPVDRAVEYPPRAVDGRCIARGRDDKPAVRRAVGGDR
ncbi:MAG: hypothetical protein FWF28_00435 [Micrococcales bacterium]|nr:hypothetical protein [Micrococcales bacterium]